MCLHLTLCSIFFLKEEEFFSTKKKKSYVDRLNIVLECVIKYKSKEDEELCMAGIGGIG
jgi:hypothetical protein